MNTRCWGTLVLSVLVGAFLLGNGVMLHADEPVYGGTLRCAIVADPETLDMHMTTSIPASYPSRHIVEGLFAFDESYTPQPMLAESMELDATGRVATFNLRRGVLFHNGKEMTSEDVVASLERWGQYGLAARALWSQVVRLEALDTYTVQMELEQPFAPMTTYLANIYGGPSIYPSEIIANAGPEPLAADQIIGTGPYMFVEWRPGDYILLKRFEDYAALDTPQSGFSGKKTAYFDQIQFFAVPEVGARVAGTQAGTYDYAANIPNDLAPTVEGDPNVIQVIIDNPPIYPIALLNNKQGIMANAGIRRAALVALDMAEIMMAGYGDSMFWDLNPSYFSRGIRWYTEGAGEGMYNQADPERARQMAADAGYAGETINMIVAADMPEQYYQAIVVQAQLIKAGFSVVVQVYDLASYFSVRNNEPEKWDMAYSFFSTTPDPSLVLMLSPTYAGWWDTPELRTLLVELNSIVDFNERYAQWEAIMDLWYEQVPSLKFGDAFQLHLMRAEIAGGYGTVRPVMTSPYFWDAWRK